jgi:pimeloyl-ACP methyl ester carboxylesterase
LRQQPKTTPFAPSALTFPKRRSRPARARAGNPLVFPDEIYRAPKSWTRRAYRNLIYFNEVDRGGHFAAWEQPELFSAELRAAFRSLRRSI